MASHSHYMDYYLSQAQTGSGIAYYAGSANQRGGGFFGNLMSGLFRFVSPLLPTLGREALRAGSHVLADVASGSKPLDSMKRHASEAGQNVLNRAVDHLRGNGIKRKRGGAESQLKRGRPPARTTAPRFTEQDIFG
jgi:hypothetical protein